jgi:uncharacterized RDD family membrane protein YckC
MKTSLRQLFLGAAIACFLTLTLAALAQDEKKNAAPPAVAPAASSAAAPAAPPASDQKEEAPLRRLDQTAPGEVHAPRPPRVRAHGGNSDNAIVSIAHDSFLAKGQKADAVVSVLGSSTSEGEVADAVVSVLGNTRVTGPVGDSAVAVVGNTYVNSKIGGQVVAVLGDVELGPDAEVGGEIVSIGGTVKRDPQALVHGSVQNVAIGGGIVPQLTGLQTWFRECAMWGRPLAFSRGLGFAWVFAIAFFALYVLIALIFGGTVDKCVTTLETRPGSSILSAILGILLTPVLIVLLIITIIGIAAVPFLVLGLFITALVGKTVMLVWVGRRFTKFFGAGPLNHAAVAALIGGAILLVIYCVPILGLLVQKSFDVLGFGVVIFTLILANKREKPAPAGAPGARLPYPLIPPTQPVPPVTSTPPPMPMSSPGFGAMGAVAGDPAAAMPGPIPPPAAPVPPPVPPVMPALAPPVQPLISAATHPRAGFLIRLAAMLLDFILVGMLTAIFHHSGSFILIVVAGYAAVMWKLKGTTIGGIVCGLKVVRLDDREVDWATAIVRALGCFLSLAVVGLGFLWVAIDDDRQSWHDKIAGTTVVRVPKGVSLL